MKRTLLDLTQSILSSLNSDQVNSISDTAEALQVAEIIKTTYLNMIGRIEPTDQKKLFQLDPSLDPLAPVLMYVPADVSKIEWIKYFNSDTTADSSGAEQGYSYVTILPVQQFLDMTSGFNPTESNVGTYTFDNGGTEAYTFYFKDDKQPQYCTILNNYYIFFDGYNAALDSTLQNSKTECYGQKIPTFTMVDSFIPDLDDHTFTLLLNESKSLAFFEMKQMPHNKAEQEAKRGWSSVQRDKSVVNQPSYFDALPNFGRGTRGGPANVSYFKTRGFDR